MHGAAFVTGAAQKIANTKYALAYAAYVEMAAAVIVRIDPSAFYLVEKLRVEFVGRGGHRFAAELRMGRSPLFDLAAIENVLGAVRRIQKMDRMDGVAREHPVNHGTDRRY